MLSHFQVALSVYSSTVSCCWLLWTALLERQQQHQTQRVGQAALRVYPRCWFLIYWSLVVSPMLHKAKSGVRSGVVLTLATSVEQRHNCCPPAAGQFIDATQSTDHLLYRSNTVLMSNLKSAAWSGRPAWWNTIFLNVWHLNSFISTTRGAQLQFTCWSSHDSLLVPFRVKSACWSPGPYPPFPLLTCAFCSHGSSPLNCSHRSFGSTDTSSLQDTHGCSLVTCPPMSKGQETSCRGWCFVVTSGLVAFGLGVWCCPLC